jgi:hypothetical protein
VYPVDGVVAQAWESQHLTALILLDFHSASSLRFYNGAWQKTCQKQSPHTSTRHSMRLQAKNNGKQDESSDIEPAQSSATRDESPPWLGIEGSQLPSDISIHVDSHKS